MRHLASMSPPRRRRDTPMLKDPARAGVQSKLPPMGRLVQPDEVAGLTAFLLAMPAASPASRSSSAPDPL